MAELNDSLVSDINDAIKAYEIAIKHHATYTHRMIDNHGHIGALTKLMNNPDLQVGFKALRDRDMLDKTFEAVILRHKSSFGRDAISVAEWRLTHPHDLL